MLRRVWQAISNPRTYLRNQRKLARRLQAAKKDVRGTISATIHDREQNIAAMVAKYGDGTHDVWEDECFPRGLISDDRYELVAEQFDCPHPQCRNHEERFMEFGTEPRRRWERRKECRHLYTPCTKAIAPRMSEQICHELALRAFAESRD
jgi:hypothetical protein